MGNKQYPDQLDNPPESPGYPPPEPHFPPPPDYNNIPGNNQYGFGPGAPPPYRVMDHRPTLLPISGKVSWQASGRVL